MPPQRADHRVATRLVGSFGTSLHLALSSVDIDAAVELVASEYWNAGVDREEMAVAHRRSTAWVGAKDAAGGLVATARAVSDGTKFGWIADVAVAKALRGRGVGTALVELLVKHPALRRVRWVYLGTADAQRFSERLGFTENDERPGYVSTWMVRSNPHHRPSIAGPEESRS